MTEHSSVTRMVRNPKRPSSDVSVLDQPVTGPISTTPEHPRLDSLAAVRCEFAKLYREVRDGRRGLRRSALMVQILREIRETLRSDQPPQIVNANVIQSGLLPNAPPRLLHVDEFAGFATAADHMRVVFDGFQFGQDL